MVVMMSDLPEPYGVLYQFAHEYDKDVPETENAAIRILEPKFKNVVIRFNQVQFIEDHLTNNLRIKYDYTIIKGEVNKKDINNFKEILGNLLYDLMLVKFSSDE